MEAVVDKDRREREHHLAKDVVLQMGRGTVADPHGAFAVVAGPMGQQHFLEVGAAVDAIERLQIEVFGRRRDRQQELKEVLALLEVAEQSKGIDRVIRVAQPAVAVVPRAPGTG